MYIIYDARHFEDYISGLSRYSFSVLLDLIKNGSFSKLEILLNKNYNYNSNPLFLNIKKEINDEKIIITYIDANMFSLKQNYIISRYVNKTECDVYFYPHFDLPLFINKRAIFVVHDLFPLILDEYVQRFSLLKKLYFKYMIFFNLIKKSTQCICVSKSTRNDILNTITNKYKSKLNVIYEDSFENLNNEIEIRNEMKELSENKYIFYVGVRRKHKNLKKMIDVFIKIKKEKLYDGNFYIAGSEKNFDLDVDKYVKDYPFIKLLGKITDSELICFYSNMDSLFFLSNYEGFGLPIVEASKLNKKIITSHKGACPEVLPPSGLSIDVDLDDYLLAKEVSSYLNKEVQIDNSEFNKQFNWKNTTNFIIQEASL